MLPAPLAHAAGFGDLPVGITLGSRLALQVPLRLEPGEALNAACVLAEVRFGERRLPLHQVLWAVDPENLGRDRVVRISTTVSVDEPWVSVRLSTLCATRLERQFTLIADPPEWGGLRPNIQTIAQTNPQALTQTLPQMNSRKGERTATGALAEAQPKPRLSAVPKPVVALSSEPSRPGRLLDQGAPRGAAPAKSLQTPVPTSAPIAPLSPGLVPKLESKPEPKLMPSAGVSSADAAPPTAATATSSPATVERAPPRSSSQPQLAIEGPSSGAASEPALVSAHSLVSEWWPWAAVAGLWLATVAGMLAWRLKQARQTVRWRAAHQIESAQLNTVSRDLDDATQQREPEFWPAMRPANWQEEPEGHLSPKPPGSAGSSAASTLAAPLIAPMVDTDWLTQREVSVEELIDLEQQADFFLALGQDDGAIDLLVGHIRHSGGVSPLPYLKLLEIYRRRGATDSYERTRTRFNQRFNAHAPVWDDALKAGRQLDDYPQAMSVIQRAWPEPARALSALEGMLMRQDDGEAFDLPAYREVLMLYAVARELQGRFGVSLDLDLTDLTASDAFVPRSTHDPLDRKRYRRQESSAVEPAAHQR